MKSKHLVFAKRHETYAAECWMKFMFSDDSTLQFFDLHTRNITRQITKKKSALPNKKQTNISIENLKKNNRKIWKAHITTEGNNVINNVNFMHHLKQMFLNETLKCNIKCSNIYLT